MSKKQSIGAVKMIAFLWLLVVLFKIGWPKNYDVPAFEKVEGCEFLTRPDGSKIIFLRLAAKAPKKPFPVIYLHGGPGGSVSPKIVEALAPLTADGFELWFYDQIGSGASDRLDDVSGYSVERHLQDLEAMVDRTGAEKIALVGQSWGGVLAAMFAARRPERVGKLVFACPGPIFPVRPELAEAVAPDSLGLEPPIFSNAMGIEKTKNWGERFVGFCAERFGKKVATDAEMDAFSAFSTFEINKSTVFDTANFQPLRAGSGFFVQKMTMRSIEKMPDPRPFLKNSTIPALVLKGERDNQKWGFGREYLELFPLSRLVVVARAGHAIHLEQPEIFRKNIGQFCDE